MSQGVALITGASRGIGYHVARALGMAGIDVALVARDTWRLNSLAADLLHQGHRALAVAVDVNDERAVEEVVDRVVKELGPITLLVNNAGIVETERPIWESEIGEWWQVICTNLRGPYLYTRAVTRHMLASGGGRIVNINSGAAFRDQADLTAYTASKAALCRLTGGTAASGAEHAISAFDLMPGVVRTEMTESMAMHEGRTDWTEPQQVIDLVLALNSGELDAWSGRMLRAGIDDPAHLREIAERGLTDNARRVTLVPYGDDDPLA